ncbi:uncharacterized protein [Procambarus clarkii]|uniref:uncharacterized protein n=1 Tax=Procambarus clarkii TaxID=6728 RepID=UPI0037446198
MTSSCVPPKSGSIPPEAPSLRHDHNGNDDNGDTSSDSDSICTCASNSTTSLDGSPVSRDVGRLDQNTESSVSPVAPPSTDTQAATQTIDSNGNPHLVIYISPPVVVPARECNICNNCRKQQQGLLEHLWLGVVKICEFCPWVVGFVIIYYCFHWWGVGPGFSAFLFTVGVHAMIRLVRTHGALECSSLQVPEGHLESNSVEERVAAESRDQRQARQDATHESANEKPPSYEAALVRPPPYDLYYHLSPAKPRDQALVNNLEGGLLKTDFLSLPSLVEGSRVVRPEDDDASLPSYQEAIIRQSYRNETFPVENQGYD